MRYDLFFLLDSPIVRIFYPKKCLTTLKVVMSMTYTCSSLERSSKCLFKEVIRLGDTASRRYIPYPDGDVCFDLTCKENDWVRRLGHRLVVLRRTRPVSETS